MNYVNSVYLNSESKFCGARPRTNVCGQSKQRNIDLRRGITRTAMSKSTSAFVLECKDYSVMHWIAFVVYTAEIMTEQNL